MANEKPNAVERAGLRFQIALYEEALARNPVDTEALRFLAHAYGLVGRGAERLATDETLTRMTPRDPRNHYNLACSHALLGNADQAIAALESACGLGFRDPVLLRRDHELDSIRDDPRFLAIEELLEQDGTDSA